MKEYKKADSLYSELYAKEYNIKDTLEEWLPILLDNKEYEKVINLYKTSAEKYSSSKIYYYCALAYERNGNEVFAQELYEKACLADDSNIDAACSLALILFNNEQYQPCEQLIYKILKKSDDDRAFYLLAEIFYNYKNIDEAIKNYSYAININPKIAVYYYKLGITYSLKGFFNEAEQSFCKALYLEPDNIDFNYTLAYLYYTEKKYDLSENITDYILRQDNKNLNTTALKILLLIEKKEITSASKYIDELNKHKNKDDFIWYVQSKYYAKLNIWNKAILAINKAVELNENSVEYKYELANDYYNVENYVLAIKNCNGIIEKNNKYIPAYILKAKILYKTAEYTKAEEMLDNALKLDINCPEIYFIKGDISYALSEYKKAIEHYKTGISINPKEKRYYELIAKSYYMLENYADAYEYYKEAAEFDISNAEIRYYMAKCAIKKGDKETALSNFSLMKRLSPNKTFYIEEYANYVNETGNKKSALQLLNQLEKSVSIKEEKARIKKLINKMKKSS